MFVCWAVCVGLGVAGGLRGYMSICMCVSVCLLDALGGSFCVTDSECLCHSSLIHRIPGSSWSTLSPSPPGATGPGKWIRKGAVGRCRARGSQNVTAWLGGQHQGVGVGSRRRAEKGDGEGPCSGVPSLLPQLLAQRLLAGAYLHGIYISFASRSIKNLTSSRLPGAACPAW